MRRVVLTKHRDPWFGRIGSSLKDRVSRPKRSSRSSARALQWALKRVSASVLHRKMVRNRLKIRRSLCTPPLVLTANSYFPGRQDLETKWVKCASTMAEWGITGWRRVGIFLFPTTSHDGQKPLPVGGVHALCHGLRPSTYHCHDSVRVYDINESVESIIPAFYINVLKLSVTSQDRRFVPSNTNYCNC